MLVPIAIFAMLCPSALSWDEMRNDAGEPLHWDDMPIRYVVNPENEAGLSEDDVIRAVKSAASVWEDSGANVDFVFEGDHTFANAEYDGVNLVFFDDVWDRKDGLLGQTTNWATDDGTVMEFDIPINTADWDWSMDGDKASMDLQNMLTHEFGHVLGLGHSDLPEATMYAQSPAGETSKRSLESDDVDGIVELYGGQALYGQPLACSSLSSTNPSPAFLLMGGLALLMPLRRRRPARQASHLISGS